MIKAKVRAEMTPGERIKRRNSYTQAEIERADDYDRLYINMLSEDPDYMNNIDVTRHLPKKKVEKVSMN